MALGPVVFNLFRIWNGLFCRSLCKAAAITPVARVVTYPVRRAKCLRRLLSVQGAAGYGLPYAACFLSIYGLSFSEGAEFPATLKGGCGGGQLFLGCVPVVSQLGSGLKLSLPVKLHSLSES